MSDNSDAANGFYLIVIYCRIVGESQRGNGAPMADASDQIETNWDTVVERYEY